MLRPTILLLAALAFALSGCAGDVSGGAQRTAAPAPTLATTTTTETSDTTASTTVAVLPTAPSPTAAAVEAWASDGGVVGATVLIVRSDGSSEEVTTGFADLEDDLPTDGTDQYRIGSITKVYTAALVMSLVEDGILDLDDAAAAYVPSLPTEITIAQLMDHTSGIRDLDAVAGIVETLQQGSTTDAPADPLQRALEGGLAFEPGTRQSYSSIGYLALQRVIEAVTGDTYERLLAEHLPLAGTTTQLEDDTSQLPTPYERLGQSSPAISLAALPTSAFARGAGAAGALVAPAEDVAGFVRSLFAGEIISEASLRLMTDTTPPRSGYGLGLSVYSVVGSDVFGHNGRTIGFASSVRHDPETNTTVVVLSNDGGARTDELAEALLAAEMAPS